MLILSALIKKKDNFEVNSKITQSLEEWFLRQIDLKSTKMVGADDYLSQLTVVIPSYCRQSFLLRQIVYWMSTSVNMILLDGSPYPLPSRIKSRIDEKMRFIYIHDPVHPVDRLVMANSLIKTPYAVTLGDDEFHLFSGLKRAIQFLQRNDDYSGCIGQSIRFFLSKDFSQVNYGKGYELFGYKACFDSPRLRFEYAMDTYNAATCYAVLRSQVWRESWGGLIKTSCKDTYEIQQALATYAAGKFATVDQIYWLRSDENISIADIENSKISFEKWWLSDFYMQERQQIILKTTSIIEKYNKITHELAESYAYSGWEMFFKFYKYFYPKPKVFSIALARKMIVKVGRAILSERIYSTMKKKLIKNFNKTPKTISADLGLRGQLALTMGPTLFKYDADTDSDLHEVESLLFDFYANI